ncbi:MAG TPA: (2Fe-2S) ferredoxin domain-containing protein, partial [Acidobacteriota bacterium]|nr:(2Fe-2S) ferredoxin domain-containing protein [Acidobacteriota bacterium]
MTDSKLLQPCCKECRHRPCDPCAHAIDCIETGPICHDDAGCRESRAARLALARRGGDGILIFIGLGTCGLANGAAAVKKRIETFLAENRVKASIIDVGCIGYCQKEVFVDIALPDRPRVAYAGVTKNSIDEILTDVLFHGRLDNQHVIGRHSRYLDETASSVAGIPEINDIPF